MKRLLSLIIVLAISLYLFFGTSVVQAMNSFLEFSFCEKPIYYTIGTIDSEFPITEKNMLEKTQVAADIWNDAIGKEIFIYDPNINHALTVNLVYDGRQASLSNINNINIEVTNQSDELKKLIEGFNEKKAKLNKEVETLNAEIKSWNEKGGAPPEEYRKLVEKRQEIEKEIENINREADILNSESTGLREKITNLNNNVNEFNILLKSRPEEGIYDPLNKRIDIYFYETDNRYIHTTAHEFGHALGLDHLDVENSILNPISSEILELSPEDIEALAEHCKNRSRVDYAITSAKLIWQNFVQANTSQI